MNTDDPAYQAELQRLRLMKTVAEEAVAMGQLAESPFVTPLMLDERSGGVPLGGYLPEDERWLQSVMREAGT